MKTSAAQTNPAGQLEEILQALTRKVRGLRAAVIVDESGLPIASDLGLEFDLETVAAMGALITQSAASVFTNLGMTGPQTIVLEGNPRSVAAATMANGNSSLLVVFDRTANLGLLRIELRRAAEMIAATLGLEFPTSSRISELFIIESSGVLIRHYSDSLRTDVDRDILSGMLTAVQSFVKQTLAMKEGALDEMRFGRSTILFVRGAFAVAAAVVEGQNLEDAKYSILDALEEFEKKYKSTLEHWNGDSSAFHGMDECFAKVLRSKDSPWLSGHA